MGHASDGQSRDDAQPIANEAQRWTRALFAHPAQRDARLALLAAWRELGLHGDDTIAAAARRAIEDHGSVRLVTVSQGGAVEQTIADLWSRAERVASGLRELGVGPGSRVAVQLPNGPEAYVSYLAVNAVGACIVPIVQIYGPADTQLILDRSGARTLLTAPRAGRPDSLDWLDGASGLDSVVVVGAGPAGSIRWESLEAADRIESLEGSGDWPAAVLYTSGTTGDPKGVLHTSNSILGHLEVMPCPSFAFEGTFLWSWPSGHIGGILAALSPFVRGIDTVLFGERWDTDLLIDTLQRYHVTGMSGVTTVGLRLLDGIEAGNLDLPLEEFFTGGASIPPALVERAEAQGCHVARSYGSTENPVVTATDRSDPRAARIGSEGRPVRGARIRILRDDDSECAPLEDGELVIVAPQQMLGYDVPERNAESFTPDGWLRTGDIGHVDEQGHLTITDRKKDIIIRGGENISSQEVEDVMMKLPAVREVAVVAMPDPELGERACAFVILHPDQVLDLQTVRAHFDAVGKGRQKCPERLEIVAEMPRTSTGKVLKKALRDQLRANSGPV